MQKKILFLTLMTLFISSASGCSSIIDSTPAVKNKTIYFSTAAESSYDTITSFNVGEKASEVKLHNDSESINGPCSFFVDESDSVYLLNTLGKNIIVKSKGKTKTINLPNVNAATDIYISDYIYVYDSFKDNPSVIKLDKTGTVNQVCSLKGKITYPEIYKFKKDKEYGLSLSSGGLGIIPLNICKDKDTSPSKSSGESYAADIQDNNKIILTTSKESSKITVNLGNAVESVKLLKDDGNIYFHASIVEATSSLIQYKNVIGIIDNKMNSSKFILLPSEEYYSTSSNTVFVSKDNKIYFMLTSKNEVQICKIK